MSDRAPSPTEPSRVFLTGGSGLLGSHIAERLLGEGHAVVALHRPGSDTSFLKGLGCTLLEGDLGDGPSQLAEQIAGCRWAVHCAARVYSGKDWSVVRAVNVEGTRNTLEAAARAGVRHAVHVSSVVVYGETSGSMDGAGPLEGTIRPDNLYARSKRLAEEVATEIHESGRMQVTIVRPSAVYGERDRLFAPNLARLLQIPVVPLMGRGDNTVPVVYAGNVAAACGLGLGRKGVWERLQFGRGFPTDPAGASRGTRPGARALPDLRLFAGRSRAGGGKSGRRCQAYCARFARGVWSEGSAPRTRREPVFVAAGAGMARLATFRTARVRVAQNGEVATPPSGQRGNRSHNNEVTET